MSATSPVSVIIVSRGRPGALVRCLAGLRQSDHPAFEVVVVADAAGLQAVAAAGLTGLVKTAACEVANISVARNIGISLAAGAVLAFIDDDAVPEPTWLSRLVAPFAEASVAAAGGFVRGRNGISYQWKARRIDRDGCEVALPVEGSAPRLYGAKPGRAIKTEGTNCAFRRDILAGIGGFDPAYAFYLDEADVNMRLAEAGHVTAIVPGAEVHHGFAASDRRTAARVPLTLIDIGASTAVFLRRHGGDRASALARLHREQRARLLRLMVAGGLVPGDVARLMQTLEDGIAAGDGRPLGPLPSINGGTEFLPLPGTGPRPGQVIAGRIWQRRALVERALRAVAAGKVVTVLCLGPTARAHKMRFEAAGYWAQTGGLFGASDRRGPRFWFCGFRARVAEETARIAPLRPTGPLPGDRSEWGGKTL